MPTVRCPDCQHINPVAAGSTGPVTCQRCGKKFAISGGTAPVRRATPRTTPEFDEQAPAAAGQFPPVLDTTSAGARSGAERVGRRKKEPPVKAIAIACITAGVILLVVIVLWAMNRDDRPASKGARRRKAASRRVVRKGRTKRTGQAGGMKSRGAGPPSWGGRPPIYDVRADAKTQIAGAQTAARRDKKRVLVNFGGNWDAWSYRLHDVFTKDSQAAAILKSRYVLVMVDVDFGGKYEDLVASYGANVVKQGIPFLIVLDAGGKVLNIQKTREFESGKGHDPAKVRAFLEKWSGGRR